MLGNLHLPQIVGGIRIIQGKEFNPIPLDQEACLRNSRSIRHFCNSTAFCPIVKMYLAKLLFSGYFKDVWLPVLSLQLS